MTQDFRIVPTGDKDLQVEFKNEISVFNSMTVTAFRTLLEQAEIPGITETLQAYRSIMVHYRPDVITYDKLYQKILALLENFEPQTADISGPRRIIDIPVLYGGEYGPDLQEVADFEGITPQEVIDLHSAYPSYVYFIGFSPGLPYIGSSVPTFTVPRRVTPRVKLPQGAVTVWRDQTTVFPMEQPGGWNVIGRTPLRMFDLHRDPVFFLQAGQWVRFRPISQAEYEAIEKQIKADTYPLSVTCEE